MSPMITFSATFTRDGKPDMVIAVGPKRATEAEALEDLDYFPKSARMFAHTGYTQLGQLYYQVRMVAVVMRGGCVSRAALDRYRCVKRNAPESAWECAAVRGYGTREGFESAVRVLS
jgi:hypothetical protein